MMYISICVTLLTMIAAMHLLAKTNKEALGSLFKWVSYAVLIVASLLLLCQVTRGIAKMCCHKECKEKSHCEMGKMGGHRGMMMMEKECRMHGEEGCCEMEKMHKKMGKGDCSYMKCEEETEKCGGKMKSGMDHREMKPDSAAGHHMGK